MIRQDVQVHTSFSDGLNSIQEIVESLINTGIKSFVITDHAKGWKTKDDKMLEFFPSIERFEDYLNQINLEKNKYEGLANVLSGLEIEIGIDGEMKLDKGILDYQNKYKCRKFGVDILLGSIHSESFEEDCKEKGVDFSNKREALLKNNLNLIRNKDIDVYAHPFQVVHGQFSNNFTQEEANKIIAAIFEEQLSGHNILIEINGKAYPTYEQWSNNKYDSGELKTYDLTFLEKYKNRGGKFVLGSDTHDTSQIGRTDFSAIKDLDLIESDIHIFH